MMGLLMSPWTTAISISVFAVCTLVICWMLIR